MFSVLSIFPGSPNNKIFLNRDIILLYLSIYQGIFDHCNIHLNNVYAHTGQVFYLPHRFHEYTGRGIHNEKEKSMLTVTVCISSHSEVEVFTE